MIVAAFESRMADHMARLITRHGGQPLVTPAMQEIPVENNAEALECYHIIRSGNMDVFILLTGVGTRTLLDSWKTRFSVAAIKQALTDTTVVVRGPKPLAVLKAYGLRPHLTVPAPNTWHDILQTLDTFKPEGLSRLTIGIQEYGTTNEAFMNALANRGAQVMGIPVYRWSLPDNVVPLQRALQAIISGTVGAAMFTSAVQVTHIVELLTKTKAVESFRQALGQMMVGSIGTITSQRLRDFTFPIDFEPSRAKLGLFVKEASAHVNSILRTKHKSG